MQKDNMMLYASISLFFFLFGIQHLNAISTSSTDVLALQSLYNETQGVNWNWIEYGAEWNFDDIATANPCGDYWQGVSCVCLSSECNVNGLYLVNFNMNGEIPPQLCDLDYVETLVFNTNSIYGALPLCLFTNDHVNTVQINHNKLNSTLPSLNYADTYPYSVLTSLDLSYNSITGSLPVTLLEIISTELVEIILNNNKLTGSIHTELLSNTLVYCNLNNNNFSGTLLPDFFNHSVQLEYFSISNNYVTGQLPTSLYQSKRLTELNFYSNQFSGEIIEELCFLQGLEYLNLRLNQFSGEIPTCIGNITSITYLNFGDLSLAGSIPNTIGDLLYLKVLDMGNNHINGSIPLSMSNLTRLTEIFLTENSMTGSLPPQVMNSLYGLKYFVMGSNSITGSLPTEMCNDNLPNLLVLDLNTNQLSGSIPTCIFEDLYVDDLYLNNNQLSGTLPINATYQEYFGIINLRKNYLTGSIPSSLCLLEYLTAIAFDDNSFSGVIPNSIGNLTGLVVLEIASNSLTGTIPSSLIYMNNLLFLSLNSNFLEGTIPELRNAELLFEIGIDFNYLTGTLPSSIGLLTSLNLLKCNSNSLSGTIPKEYYELTNLNTLLIQSNLFTGDLNLFFNSSNIIFPYLETIDLSDNGFSSSIPSNLFYNAPNVLNVSLSQNCFTGKIPDSMCVCTKVQFLYLDGLSAGSSCQIPLSVGANHNGFGVFPYIYTSSYLGGTIPSCFFKKMPNMLLLHIAGNGISSTLPDINQSYCNLNTIVLSNNRIYESIPYSWQTFSKLQKLDLSYNLLTGGISDMDIIYNYNLNETDRNVDAILATDVNMQPDAIETGDVWYSDTNGTLKLNVNRLSGDIPDAFLNAPSLSVLDGNLFNCALDQSDLPLNDPNNYKYICASHGLDASMWITFACFMIPLLVALVYLLQQHCTSSNQRNHSFMHKCVSIFTMLGKAISFVWFKICIKKEVDIPVVIKVHTPISDAELLYMKELDNQEQGDGMMAKLRFLRKSTSKRFSKFMDDASVSNLFRRMNRSSDNGEGTFENNSKRTTALENPQETITVIDFENTRLFFRILFEIRIASVVVSILALVAYLPAYVIMKQLGPGSFSTHTHQYGWIVSAAYLSSVPGYVLLALWVCTFMMVLVMGKWMRYRLQPRNPSVEMSNDGDGDRGSGRGLENGATDIKRIKSIAKTNSHLNDDYTSDCTTMNDTESHFNPLLAGLNEHNAEEEEQEIEDTLVLTLQLQEVGEEVQVDVGEDADGATNEAETAEFVETAHISADDSSNMVSLNTDNVSGGIDGAVKKRNTFRTRAQSSRIAVTQPGVMRYTSLRLIQLFINCVIVLFVNGVYTYVERSYSDTIRVLAVILVTGFRIVWMVFVVPRLIDWQFDIVASLKKLCNMFLPYKYQFQRREKLWAMAKFKTLLQYCIVIFNNVLAPCLAVAITDSRCFYHVFVPPNNLENSVSYSQCDYFDTDANGAAFCVSYSAIHPYTTSFTPPFIYSYQCSSALLTTYVPVYILQFALAGSIFPMLKLFVMQHMTTLCYENGKLLDPLSYNGNEDEGFVHKVLRIGYGLIPKMLFPLEHTLNFRREALSMVSHGGGRVGGCCSKNGAFNVVRPFVEARIFLFQIVGAYCVLLTFGLAYPPLAVVIAISVCTSSLVLHMIIQKHITDCFHLTTTIKKYVECKSTEDPDADADADGNSGIDTTEEEAFQLHRYDYLVLFHSKVERDCQKLWKVFIKSLSLLLACCSVYYGLYFIDTIPHSITPAMVAVCIPVGYHLVKNILRLGFKSIYENLSNYMRGVLMSLFLMKKSYVANNTTCEERSNGIELSNINNRNTSNGQGNKDYDRPINPVLSNPVLHFHRSGHDDEMD